MEKITNEKESIEDKIIEKINDDNNQTNTNIKEENNNSINALKPNQEKLNLNNKYDSALLEEINNSKTKSWRMDITNGTQEEFEKKFYEVNNLIEKNVKSNNDSVNKDDRFKDFDEILILEENKNKKRKNHSNEKIGKIPKPSVKRKNNENNFNKKIMENNENNNINKNSSTISELNKYIENYENDYKDKNKKNECNIFNDMNRNVSINSNDLNEAINKNIYSTNKNNINLEYSEDKKCYEEINEKNTIKNNNLELIIKDKITKENLYNNFIDYCDKNKEEKQFINNINSQLLKKNNTKYSNLINNNNKTQLKVSKSCNIRSNLRSIKSNKENNYIYPNKSQNIKKSLICDKNTINIQLSIKRKTRSAKDIKKHMSYYLMDEKIKSPKNEINNFIHFINEFPTRRQSNSNSLNSFLSLQISSKQINSKNHFKFINTPFNIFKNSFKDKIKKKMSNINGNRKFKKNISNTKNNYINLEFFEESKQDNFFEKNSNNFYESKNKLFENKTKKDIDTNKFKFSQFQKKLYNEQNKENNMFFSNSDINKSKNRIHNYLFEKSLTKINTNKKRIFSPYSNGFKIIDHFKEKNKFIEIYNYNTNPFRKFEFELSNTLFNTTKNKNLYRKLTKSHSYTSIFHNRLNNKISFSYL